MECTTIFDIVLNFISLSIISEFDNFVYGSLRKEKFKELLSEENQCKILQINFTTSITCHGGEDGDLTDLFDEDTGKQLPMKIRFQDRSFMNKLLFMLYRVY